VAVAFLLKRQFFTVATLIEREYLDILSFSFFYIGQAKIEQNEQAIISFHVDFL
jgi:hypothetical protein